MATIRTLAGATYGEITRRPLYYVLLLSFAAGIFFSKLLTLFTFHQEMNLVREMGIATITFWGFIIVVLNSGLVVTRELEDRTAVTLLSKPLRRSDFLLGKYLGIMASLLPGVFVLSGVLFLTLLLMAMPHLPLNDRIIAENLSDGTGPFATTWKVLWEGVVLTQGGVVLEGAFLTLLQVAILGALAVSFSAFFPTVVSAAATTLLFILGNLSSYMVAGVEKLDVGALTMGVKTVAHLLPHLGYFNLQTAFSEGKIVSLDYLLMVSAYAGLYVGSVFLVSCSLFRKREVR